MPGACIRFCPWESSSQRAKNRGTRVTTSPCGDASSANSPRNCAGNAENYDTHRGPIDYDAWPFAHQLTRALDTAQVHAFCLGIGVDPLTFATDILTVVTHRRTAV